MLSALGLKADQSAAGGPYADPKEEVPGAKSRQRRSSETSADRVQSGDFLVKHANGPRQIIENQGDQNTSLQPGDLDGDSSSQILLCEDAGDGESGQESPLMVFSPSHVVQTAHLPLQIASTQQAEPLSTSFTEDEDSSVSGGGLENEIQNLKSLLGLLAQDLNLQVVSPPPRLDGKPSGGFYGYHAHDTMLKDRDFNKTFEHHN